MAEPKRHRDVPPGACFGKGFPLGLLLRSRWMECRGPFMSPGKRETYQAFSTIMRPRISISSA